jgi:PPM family protein phosphatase
MRPSDSSHLAVVTITHPGMTGKNNEDRFLVSPMWSDDPQPLPVLLAVLCDGIGGHRAGEVAAEIAVNTITRVISASNGANPLQSIQEGIQAASQEIYNQAQSDPEQQGMGATCVCALIIGKRLYAATVGDSRLYRMNSGKIQQISTDHSWIQDALDHGVITPEQAKNHPNAHVIRRFLGSQTPPEVDFRLKIIGNETDAQAIGNQGFLIQPGDRWLLCSDGLSDLVKPAEILAAFEKQDLDSASRTLVDLACDRGGYDNITMVCVAAPEAPKKGGWVKWRPWALGCLGLAIVSIILAVIILGVVWLRSQGKIRPTPTGELPTLNSVMTTPLPEQAAPVEATLAQLFNDVNPTAAPAQRVGPTLTAWPTNTPAPQSTPTP